MKTLQPNNKKQPISPKFVPPFNPYNDISSVQQPKFAKPTTSNYRPNVQIADSNKFQAHK